LNYSRRIEATPPCNFQIVSLMHPRSPKMSFSLYKTFPNYYV